MAHYNTQTKEIKGCVKNSPVYWHEKCHELLDKLEIDIQFKFWKDISLFVAVFYLTYSRGMVSRLFIMASFFFYFGEEIVAWIYSLINFRKWNK